MTDINLKYFYFTRYKNRTQIIVLIVKFYFAHSINII